MKRIPLSKGLSAVVSDRDYRYLCQWNWWANTRPNGPTYAARQTSKRKGRKNVYMHTLIATRKGLRCKRVDHVDGNGLNNCRSNLRAASTSQNGANRRRQQNTSGYKGVSPNKSRWQARIRINWELTHLGTFDTPKQAARAYDKEALKLHGRFARLNFPRSQ